VSEAKASAKRGGTLLMRAVLEYPNRWLSIRRGTSECLLLLDPSAPVFPYPQLQTFPSLLVASMWECPLAACTIFTP